MNIYITADCSYTRLAITDIVYRAALKTRQLEAITTGTLCEFTRDAVHKIRLSNCPSVIVSHTGYQFFIYSIFAGTVNYQTLPHRDMSGLAQIISSLLSEGKHSRYCRLPFKGNIKTLTNDEQKIISGLLSGITPALLARKQGMHVRDVSRHKRSAMIKLGIRTTQQLYYTYRIQDSLSRALLNGYQEQQRSLSSCC